MCSGQAVAAGIRIGGAVAQFGGDQRSAEQQEAYNNKMFRINRRHATRGAHRSYGASQDRISQERASAQQDVLNASRAHWQALGTARVAAAAGGIGGTTINDIANEYALQSDEYEANRFANLNWQTAQILRQMENIRDEQHRSIVSRIPGPQVFPTSIDLLLGLLGGGASAAASQSNNSSGSGGNFGGSPESSSGAEGSGGSP